MLIWTQNMEFIMNRNYLTECTCKSSCCIAGFKRSNKPSAIASCPGEVSTTATAAILLASLSPDANRKYVSVTWGHKKLTIFFLRLVSSTILDRRVTRTWLWNFVIILSETLLFTSTSPSQANQESLYGTKEQIQQAPHTATVRWHTIPANAH